MTELSRLCLKTNTGIFSEVCCAACLKLTQPRPGVEIFVEGTDRIVCPACAAVYAPDLAWARERMAQLEYDLVTLITSTSERPWSNA